MTHARLSAQLSSQLSMLSAHLSIRLSDASQSDYLVWQSSVQIHSDFLMLMLINILKINRSARNSSQPTFKDIS